MQHANNLKLLHVLAHSRLYLALFIVTLLLLRFHALLIYYYVPIVAPC